MLIVHTFFLKMISDHLIRRKTDEPIIPVDWRSLMQLAQIHQVDGILHFQCKKFLPDEIGTILEERFGTTLFLSANREKMVSRLMDTLDSENIKHFVIKGAALAAYYPFPVLRTMGDTDLVVQMEDRQLVHEILLSQGFENKSRLEDREWIYWKNQMEFELHDHLVYSESINEDIQEKYFNDFWKYVHNDELDWNFHFLFLVFHLRKHFMNSGVGIRHFMDIAVLCLRGPDFDWSWIETELKKLGMWTFAERVFALNKHWFEVEPPVDVEEISEEFCSSATDLILKNGVFGFDNEDNRDKTK